MGMKEKSFSLRAIFISYFATVILACALLTMLILIALNLAYRSGAIIPANNAEQYLIEQKGPWKLAKSLIRATCPMAQPIYLSVNPVEWSKQTCPSQWKKPS